MIGASSQITNGIYPKEACIIRIFFRKLEIKPIQLDNHIINIHRLICPTFLFKLIPRKFCNNGGICITIFRQQDHWFIITTIFLFIYKRKHHF